MQSKTAKGYLFAILSAVIFGCMPLMSSFVYADGVTPMTLVFLRNALSLLPLGLLAYKEHGSLKIPVKLLPSISLIAVLGCSITPILLFTSYQFIPSGTATVFHFAYPAFVVVGGIIFLKEKATKSDFSCTDFSIPQTDSSLLSSHLVLVSSKTASLSVKQVGHCKKNA